MVDLPCGQPTVNPLLFRIAETGELGPGLETERRFVVESKIVEPFRRVDMKQGFEPKAAAKMLPDGTMVSVPLEDLAPFLPEEELKENMIIPLVENK